MKNILLVLLMLISSYVSGQPYQKLIRENIFWEQFYWVGASLCGTVGAARVFFQGDTLVNNINYSKIYGYPIMSIYEPTLFCSPFAVDTSQAYLMSSYALREDTVE